MSNPLVRDEYLVVAINEESFEGRANYPIVKVLTRGEG